MYTLFVVVISAMVYKTTFYTTLLNKLTREQLIIAVFFQICLSLTKLGRCGVALFAKYYRTYMLQHNHPT